MSRNPTNMSPATALEFRKVRQNMDNFIKKQRRSGHNRMPQHISSGRNRMPQYIPSGPKLRRHQNTTEMPDYFMITEEEEIFISPRPPNGIMMPPNGIMMPPNGNMMPPAGIIIGPRMAIPIPVCINCQRVRK